MRLAALKKIMEALDNKQDYLAKANEAKAFADQSADVVTRNSWLRISENYRKLASFVNDRSSKSS
jgi:hypothetical protein